MEIIKIALAGGPGSGKTTVCSALKNASTMLPEDTALVFLPETATFHFSHRDPVLTTEESIPVRQHYIFSSQLLTEKTAEDTAHACGKKRLIMITDRGILDCAVYLEHKDFLKASGLNGLPLDHYDLVLFFTGGADITEDDTYRIESDEERRILADKTYKTWSQVKDHISFKEIPQQETAEEKIREAKLAINTFLKETVFL